VPSKVLSEESGSFCKACAWATSALSSADGVDRGVTTGVSAVAEQLIVAHLIADLGFGAGSGSAEGGTTGAAFCFFSLRLGFWAAFLMARSLAEAKIRKNYCNFCDFIIK